MLEFMIVCVIAFFTSFITLFSGFGLSTVLMPVFSIFFPIPIAIAATAIVHLSNNLFKAILVGRHANKSFVFKFAVPATVSAVIGAYLVSFISDLRPIFSYQILQYSFDVSLIGLVIGLIVFISAIFEFVPVFSKLAFNQKYIFLGGLFSGFFGGLSGHQGALRSAFLIKTGLNKEQFIGTSVLCSIFVDAVRLIVYGMSSSIKIQLSHDMVPIIFAASISAFAGAYIGTRFIEKITYKTLQTGVGIMLMILGVAIILGL